MNKIYWLALKNCIINEHNLGNFFFHIHFSNLTPQIQAVCNQKFMSKNRLYMKIFVHKGHVFRYMNKKHA